MRINFRWQIIALFASAVLLLAVLGSLTGGVIINKRVSDLVYDQATQITSGFAHRSILSLLSGTGDSVIDDLESILAYSNVKSLGIYTADAELLIGTDPEERLEPSELLPVAGTPFEPKVVRETRSLWIFAAPVYDTDVLDHTSGTIDTLFAQTPRPLGFVSVTIDRSNLFKIQQELLQDNLFISVAIALLLLLLAVLITDRMVKPLYQFISLMRKAEKGDDGVRADLAGPIEIENMSRAFNTMMHALAQRREHAEQQYKSLRQEIDERARVEKALRESENNLKTLLTQHEAMIATIPGIIVEVDQQGRPIWWNRRAEQITGYSRAQIADMNIADFVPRNFMSVTQQAMADCINNRKSELHTDIITPDGNVPYQFNSVRVDHPSQDPGKATVLAVGMDESESVNAQIALKEAHDAALESARVKSEFLANMSHEIRTPMNGMLGMLQLLANSSLDPEQKNYAEIALRSADHLLGIINDVLDFSKIEAGKLELHTAEFSPRNLIEDVVELFATRAYEKGLRIYADVDFDIPRTIISDSHRLKQILSNLVSNAIKFTDEGYVLVHGAVAGRDEKASSLVIDVIDTGVGIEGGSQERVFESFAQMDGSSTRKYSGTGLGLAIVKQLCELLGGHVGLESEYGKGSRFSITLPLDTMQSDYSPEPVGVPLSDRLVVNYLSNDRLQSSIFEKYCEYLDKRYRLLSPRDCRDLSPVGSEQLFFVDAESFADLFKSEIWTTVSRYTVYILVNHVNSHSVEERIRRLDTVAKILIPIRFKSFVELLSQETTESDIAAEKGGGSPPSREARKTHPRCRRQ